MPGAHWRGSLPHSYAGCPLPTPQDHSLGPRHPRAGSKGGQEGMRGHALLTIQPSKARNCQKVKIPFVNKIELFDCETRVHGI